MMGMHQRKIAVMMFCENIVMVFLALCIGIGLGILLSKGFLIFLMNLVGYRDVVIPFSIPRKALMLTMVYYMILVLFSAAANYLIICRYKLIDLFKGEAVREKSIKRSKTLNIILGSIFILILFYGYYLSVQLSVNPEGNYDVVNIIIRSFICVVIATYGIYFFVIEMIFDLLKRFKTYYFKGLNLFINRQITHRIYTNSKMLATITMLIGTTLVVFGSTFSYYYTFDKEFDNEMPFSYEFSLIEHASTYDMDEINKRYNEVFEKHKDKNPILYDYTVYYPNIAQQLLDVEQDDEYIKRYSKVRIINETAYNKLVKHGNQHLEIYKEAHLEKESDIIIIDMYIEDNGYSGKQSMINNEVFDIVSVYNTDITECCCGERAIFIVKDSVFERLSKQAESFYVKRYVIVKDAKKAKELSRGIQEKAVLSYTDYYYGYRLIMDSKAIYLFVGLFVGLVFLFVSGTILSLKQLFDSDNDRQRYNILRKMGVHEKKIKSIIAKQIGIVFFMPVILAALHSYFALGYVSFALQGNIMVPVAAAVGGFSLIYLLYYLATVRSYYAITK